MKWTCPSCKLSIEVRRFPVHCACGVSSNGDDVVVRKKKNVTDKKELPLGFNKPCRKRWYSTASLVAETITLLPSLPMDVSRVIGVPRSGMIPASIVATYLHVPLYSITRDNKLIELAAGDRMNHYQGSEGKTILVEDSVGIGRRMKHLAEHFPIGKWFKMAIYVLPRSQHLVDLFAKGVPAPHLFEWNFFNGWFMRYSALDMDGIICRDGSQLPLYLPRNIACRAIITARPEANRDPTIHWLEKHGVKYDELIMWPGDPEKRNLQTQADWKADQIKKIGVEIYVESCPFLSHELRQRSVRVLCPKEGILQ